MRTLRRIALIAALPLVGAAGCNDFLTGPKVGTNPNTPTAVSRDLLFVAMQAQQFQLQEGLLARVANMWVNAMAGTERQFTTIDQYDIIEEDFSTEWDFVYGGGGLLDMRAIIASAEQDAPVYAGIVKVWEALTIGTAASFWGAIPYSTALDPAAPASLDDQAAVYQQLQALLDDAISDLQTGQGSPGSLDLIYGGDANQWIQAAYTLKARFYMHNAKVDPNAAAQALAATANGIMDPADNFVTSHSSAAGEENPWFQFMFRERGGYMKAGKTLVDLLVARNDPRLSEYFDPFGGTFKGAGQAAACSDCSELAFFGRGAAAAQIPLISASENLLLRAEAAYLTGQTTVAQQALNDYQDIQGLPNTSPTGGALLLEIYTEAYIALFQNVEIWNWYKRSCYPNLDAVGTATFIPRRVYYSVEERNANPNIPAPDTPGNTKIANENDLPHLATVPYGAAACLGQANAPNDI